MRRELNTQCTELIIPDLPIFLFGYGAVKIIGIAARIILLAASMVLISAPSSIMLAFIGMANDLVLSRTCFSHAIW